MRSKKEIIRKALLIKINPEAYIFDIFSADDILTVLGIDKIKLEELKKKYKDNEKEFFESISL